MKRNIVESYSIEEAFRALNKRSNSKAKVSEALEAVKIQLTDPGLVSADDLSMYAANPTVQKYASREVFTKITKEGAVLEMTSDDFGDGHGEPKGYIFAKDGKVGYILLSSNAYDYVPSISYRDFKSIVEGKDLLWNEIGFGDFSAAANYVGEPVASVDDIIAECEVQSSVYLWNMENLEESVACKSTKKVVEAVDANRTFAQVANVVPFKDFISGKSMIYFLQDFAGITGELYIVSYNGDVYGLDTGNEIAEYICATHEVTSYDDLAEFANYSPNDIDGDVGLYGEKNIPVASFNYDGLNVDEFIKKFEFEPPRITETATKKVNESVDDAIVTLPGDAWGYPEFFADEVEEFGPEIIDNMANMDDQSVVSVVAYYYNKQLNAADLKVKNIFVLNPKMCDDITEEEAEELLEKIKHDPAYVLSGFGFQLANNDYIYTDENHNFGPVYVKCRDYNSMVKYINGEIELDRAPFGDAKDIIEEGTKKVVESADSTYTAIMLKETVLAIDDVDSDGNHYDTVKDEFIPVTIRANSDREAVEKISQYVPIVLDDYDYSEDDLINEINNAVFPIAFEDWNSYYYDVGDSNMAIISLKRPDGKELATESEIQAADVNDAVKKYNEFYLPENSIHDWGLKFDSITVGKPISL